jgi:hypothetical protein
MVQVIDTVGDAGGAESIRFRVRRSRRDPNLILGSYASAINASIAWIGMAASTRPSERHR